MKKFDIMKSLVNQKFGEVRVIVDGDNIWFCGSDVAKALGYAIPSKAVNTHCKGVSKMEAPTGGGNQTMLFIPEGDVYRLIIKSKLPEAEEFEHWLFDEMLPTLRKGGVYITEEEKVMNTYFKGVVGEQRELLSVMLKNLREQIEENEKLSLTNKCLTKETRTWDKRKVVVAMIRSLASRVYHSNYMEAYKDFYKELRYKKGICLSQRTGSKNKLDNVKDDEWDDLIQVATAMLEEYNIPVADVVNETNMDTIIDTESTTEEECVVSEPVTV